LSIDKRKLTATRKLRLFLFVAVACIVVATLAISKPASVPIIAQLTGQHRPDRKMPTITTLPEFPGIPLYASLMSRKKQLELIQTLIKNKISTWPANSPIPNPSRIGSR
jgi:hypothetical protein